MALSRSEIQVQWSSADYKDVTSGSTGTSDVFTMQSALADAMVQLKADNQSTPADGDTVGFYLAATLGDPDGASTDEYPTDVDNMILLGIIDTYDTDAESKVVSLPKCKAGKIVAKSNAASNTIRVSACILQWYVS